MGVDDVENRSVSKDLQKTVGLPLPWNEEVPFCPYCIAKLIHDTEKYRGDDDFLFINTAYEQVKKAIMVKSMVAVITAVKNAVKDMIKSITGHSLRVSGAQFLARIGLELMLIQILGRWDSNIILRYIADAPVANITANMKMIIGNDTLEEKRLNAHGQTTMPCSAIDELRTQAEQELESKLDVIKEQARKEADEIQLKMSNLDFEISVLRELVADDVQTISNRMGDLELLSLRTVKVGAGELVHKVRIGTPAPPIKWRTFCGKYFAHADYQLVDSEVSCKACHRSAAKNRPRLAR